MEYVRLGPLVVRVREIRQLPDEVSGALVRTVNGQLRGRSDWVKRGWEMVLIALDAAELAAIRTAANPATTITVSGAGVPTIQARTEIDRETTHLRAGAGVIYYVPVTVREV